MAVPPKPGIGGGSGSTAVLLALLAVAAIGTLFMGVVLLALLLPAVQGAREAARRTQCANNLKQIALALHNYHDTYKSFPPAYTVDSQGQRLHSWRTLILPFLEQQSLHDQIRLEEPWNSPHNRQFHATLIPSYLCPSNPDSVSPSYRAVVGQGCIFEGATAIRIADVLDGMSNTILVVETAGGTGNWMEPVDLDFEAVTRIMGGGPGDPNSPSSFHRGGVQVAMADGAVRFLSESIGEQQLKRLLLRNDGEVTPAF